MPCAPGQPPDAASGQLQALTRRIGQLKPDLVAERTRLQAEGYRAGPTDQIASDIQVHIRPLQRRSARLKKQAHALGETTPPLQAAYQRLGSIPGIGPTPAVRVNPQPRPRWRKIL